MVVSVAETGQMLMNIVNTLKKKITKTLRIKKYSRGKRLQNYHFKAQALIRSENLLKGDLFKLLTGIIVLVPGF